MATSIHQPITLVASQTTTATNAGTTAVRPHVVTHNPVGWSFILDLTDAATDAGDTLDVFVQTMVDGTNWVDVVAFTQILGNGSNTLRYYAKINSNLTTAMFENATALAAGSVRNFEGEQWRCRWDLTDGGADNATFTFSVTMVPF